MDHGGSIFHLKRVRGKTPFVSTHYLKFLRGLSGKTTLEGASHFQLPTSNFPLPTSHFQLPTFLIPTKIPPQKPLNDQQAKQYKENPFHINQRTGFGGLVDGRFDRFFTFDE